MAAITKTSMTGAGSRAVVRTTLGASDTLTYTPGKKAILILDNVTGGTLTPNIDGAAASTVPVAGVGTIDISAGYSVGAIVAGACAAIPLDSISSYLSGVITVTGGTGIKASILEL